MASPASIGKHPMHPMLVAFPIGLWVFSFVSDLVYLWKGNPVWRDYLAFYTLAGGIIGAVIAAVPGFVDWLSIKDKPTKKVGNLHAIFNVSALIIFIGSFYLRTTGGSQLFAGGYSAALVLSFLGLIFIGVSGWFGGTLVYEMGMAVTPAGTSKR